MVFKDYINALPNLKQDTISKIAEITDSSTVSVYRWIRGESKCPKVKQKIIAKHLNMDIKELFPEEPQKKEAIYGC